MKKTGIFSRQECVAEPMHKKYYIPYRDGGC